MTLDKPVTKAHNTWTQNSVFDSLLRAPHKLTDRGTLSKFASHSTKTLNALEDEKVGD